MNYFGSAIYGSSSYSTQFMTASTDSYVPGGYMINIQAEELSSNWTPRSAMRIYAGRCPYCNVKYKHEERYCVACGAPTP